MTLNMTHSSMVSVVCVDHICLLGTKHCYQGLKCPGDAKLSLNKRLNSLLIAFFCKEKTNWEIIHVLHQLLVLGSVEPQYPPHCSLLHGMEICNLSRSLMSLNSLLPRIDIEIDKYLAQNIIVINFYL